jgi:prepilin-type N-terminal cleavage/methylation domain-containing protein
LELAPPAALRFDPPNLRNAMKKNPLLRRRSGFTLIELLVVITIIAALAALSFAGVMSALKKAKITKGKVAASNLVQAVNAFYSEYGRLPDLGDKVTTDEGEGVQLISILLAEDGTEEENPRGLNFLTIQEGQGKKGGLYYGSGGGGATVQGLFDPFGEPYTVVLNTEYEDTLTFQMGGKTFNLRGEQVAVFSVGPDLEEGTRDDITSFKQ